MLRIGVRLRPESIGGTRAAGEARRTRAATAATVAALASLGALAGCHTPPTRAAVPTAGLRSEIDSALGLYDAGDYALAAMRFRGVYERAGAGGHRHLATQAVTAECASWLRARDLRELSTCTTRLEGLQRHTRRSDPGLNTLVGMGAIAGDRPLPSLRIPGAVHPILRTAAEEEG